MKSLLSWFVLIVSIAVVVSSCAKSDDSKTSTSTDAAAITGETMTIGSISYTSSLLSSCIDLDLTSTAGGSVYEKE